MGGGSARGDGGGTHIDVCISAYDLRIVVFLRRLRYRVDGVIKNGWCSWWWTNICYIARLNGVDFAVSISPWRLWWYSVTTRLVPLYAQY